MRKKIKKTKVSITYFEKKIDVPLGVIKMQEMCVRVRSGAHVCVCVFVWQHDNLKRLFCLIKKLLICCFIL